MLETLVTKLHPSRFPNMSPFMQALVGFILEQAWTTPEIKTISITWMDDAIINGRFMGVKADEIDQNLGNLAAHAELTPKEAEVFYNLYKGKIDDHRDTKRTYITTA